MKHTSGEWNAIIGARYPSEDYVIIPASTIITDTPRGLSVPSDKIIAVVPNKADAHLMAAAPEMLEALKMAGRDEEGWHDKARSVIAKAEEK